MIKIEIDKNRLDDIVKRYSKFIIKRIKRPEIDNPVYNHFKDNLSQIISSPYAEMKGIIDDFKKKFKEQEEISKFYPYIKDEYERLFQLKIEPGISLGSWLAKELDIRVCPYCNRQYTFTVIKEKGGGKGTRPQFDHFHPKSRYPYLALSFYNLVPSCPTCNHTKAEDEIELNPYDSGFPDKCRFKIDNIEKCILNSESKDWKIILPSVGKHLKNVKAFALDSLYNEHKDYVEEIVFKAKAYNEDYYKELIDTFTKLELSKNEMNLMIFGNYVDSSEHHKRPLSKLSTDILKQLKLNL